MDAEESIREGNLNAALAALQTAVRNNPARPEYRTFLFQLLSVMGDWDRALTQLNVVSDMDASTLLMAQTYRELLQCEAFRAQVFEGRREPLWFGEPDPSLNFLIQSLAPAHQRHGKEASELAQQAAQQASVRSGSIDGQNFEWIGDADMRMGPVFELIVNGKYYWVPMDAVATITFSEPEDLRDLVWLPAHIDWINGGHSVGFMPCRYPGDATFADPLNALSRKTEWHDLGEEFFIGAGQRMFYTDQDDYALFDVRKITFHQH